MSDKRKDFKDEIKETFNGVFSGGLAYAPFFSAIKKGNLEAVEKMLERGLDPNCYSFGKAALHVAVETSTPAVVEMLLRNGANIEIPMKAANKNTPLDQAIVTKKPEMIKLLIRYGAQSDQVKNNGWSSMHQAAVMGHSDVIFAMLQADAKPDALTTDGRTPLYLAIEREQLDVVKVFTQAKSINQVIHRQFVSDGLGYTPLYLAATKGNVAIIQALVDAGADIEGRITTGWTPLAAAILEGHETAVDYLVQSGANIDKALCGQWKNTPLHVAASAKQPSKNICEILLRSGANPNKQNKEGYTPIMLAAQRGRNDVIKTFIRYGATPNVYDATGKTPLLHAIEAENIETVKLLLSVGGRHDLKNMKTGEYPLHTAIRLGDLSTVQALVQSGASLKSCNESGQDALTCAKYYQNRSIQDVLKKADQPTKTTGIDKSFKL